MASVDHILAAVEEISDALDHLARGSLPPSVQAHLSRGIAVAAFQASEQFIADRGEEWAAILTGHRLHNSQLPDGGMPYATRIVKVLPRELSKADTSSRASLLQDVSRSLASLSSGTFSAHQTAFSWMGSNVQEDDVEDMLKVLGSEKPWGDLTQVWKKIDKSVASNAHLKAKFNNLAMTRHGAAHSSNPSLPLPTMLTLPADVAMFCACFDAMGSALITRLKSGDKSTKWQPNQIKVRRLVEESGKWAEYSPEGRKARRRHASLQIGWDECRTFAEPRKELAVCFDNSGKLVNWASYS